MPGIQLMDHQNKKAYAAYHKSKEFKLLKTFPTPFNKDKFYHYGCRYELVEGSTPDIIHGLKEHGYIFPQTSA